MFASYKYFCGMTVHTCLTQAGIPGQARPGTAIAIRKGYDRIIVIFLKIYGGVQEVILTPHERV